MSIRRYLVLIEERFQYTPFFKFKSTAPTLIYKSILLSGLLVRQKWQSQRYDWSNRLSVLAAKGQLN